MMRSPSICTYATLAMLAVLAAACSSQMDPARQALASADSAVSAAAVDAARYMPEQQSSLQGRLADLKSAFDQKNYALVLARSPSLTADAQAVARGAAAKKASVMRSAAAEWIDLSASMPKLIDTVSKRVDALAKQRHVPKGVDLAAAHSALVDAADLWSKAQAAFGAGNVDDAVTAARQSRGKAQAAAAAVNLKLEGPPA
jgi:hypothetical protein